MTDQQGGQVSLPRAKVKKGGYQQKSVRKRILAFFMDNLGKVATGAQVEEAATDPETGAAPENWHQRLSELRTDHGYNIYTSRDRRDLKPSEYLMLDATKRAVADKRVKPTPQTWQHVLNRAGNACEWKAGDGQICGLKNGDIDPVGGGTVKLTPDHKRPHSVHPGSDPSDTSMWDALCGRHQVMKKNFWDSSTGKMNYVAIVQAAPLAAKKEIFVMLTEFFSKKR